MSNPPPRPSHSSGIVRLLVLFFIGVAAVAAWRYEIHPPIRPEAGWVPPHPSNRWTCIVIHHSGSDAGGADRFDEWHRKRGWDQLGYHFVIGNGTDTAMGQVERGANRIYGIERDRPSARKYGHAVVMVLTVGLSTMVGFLLIVAGSWQAAWADPEATPLAV